MALITVAGSERFVCNLRPDDELRSLAERHVKLHSVESAAIDTLDPLTYEVIRHRLTMITEEMGAALKRMSGSVVVTDCNDFGVAILDECGNTVFVGLYNTQLAAGADMMVKWTLENRSSSPGIAAGDMFLGNDPWVGGGVHQNDVCVIAPLFHEGELFAWSAAVCHQVDLGGMSPGSWSVHGQDVFGESTPIPPVKMVSAGKLQSDIEDMYLRRSRVPRLVALDLRAKIGANNIAQELLNKLIEKYGASIVKAVMRRMLTDAESRLRTKLRSLPDGVWGAVAHQDSARAGDRGIYKIAVKMTKQDDRLVFDFGGTDPQVEGFINCTYTGLRGGVLSVVLSLLCGDIPWAAGGIHRCFEIISEPGTINNCLFPAGIGKASVASAWATASAVMECVSKMLSMHPEHCKSAMSPCCGSWDLTVLAGVDQRGGPFVTMLCDAMASGLGARVDQDGVDTGGVNHIPMGRMADVEINEFAFPMLYLWRREEADSGGPGRFRGGVGASSCFIAHDSPLEQIHLVISAPGKALPQAPGLSGGYPASTQHDVLIRDTRIRQMLADGRIPATLDEVAGQQETMPAHVETELGRDDVYYTHWQGGGGFGDPLLRDSHRVADDLRNSKISIRAAQEIYGVLLLQDGTVDEAGTNRLRHHLRRRRIGVASG